MFLFLSIDHYERSLSFSSEACYGIKSVDGLMKLHAAFPSTPNKLCVRKKHFFFVKIVLERLSGLKQHAMVGEWLICSERGIPQYYQVVKRLSRY